MACTSQNKNEKNLITSVSTKGTIPGGCITERNKSYTSLSDQTVSTDIMKRDKISSITDDEQNQQERDDDIRGGGDSTQLERGGICGGSGGSGSGETGILNSKDQKLIENVAIGIHDTMVRVLAETKPVLDSWSTTISEVPQKFKDVYGHTLFKPKLICIGPLHHFDPRFEAMKTHKWRFFYRFLNSMNNSTSGTVVATDSKKIECLLVAFNNLQASLRACYSQNDHHDYLHSEIFVQMMMIDGCFIIELLRLCEKLDKEKVVDPLFSSRWTIAHLRHDLLILENQLPFTVLETLFEMSTSFGNADQHEHSLKYLILKFFNPLLPREKKVLDHVLTVVDDKKPHHLLDFFRSSFRAQQEPDNTHIHVNIPASTSNDDQDRLVLIHCVTELRKAGIKFRKRGKRNLLDIEFKNGKLYIPPLLIDENTSSVFLNFLVYEQCNQSLEPYFTNYLLFFDGLVDTSIDIEHLHYKGITDHVLSSDEQVTNLFNKLCKDAVHDLADNYLSKVLKDVNRYSGRRWNKWRAAWRHTYFRNPWAFSSFLAAVFLLILTTIQTFFSVYAYFAPPS